MGGLLPPAFWAVLSPSPERPAGWAGVRPLSHSGARRLHCFRQLLLPLLVQLLSPGTLQSAPRAREWQSHPMVSGVGRQNSAFQRAWIPLCGCHKIVPVVQIWSWEIKTHTARDFLSLAFSRCSPEPVPDCDPLLESEARKNTACGMITDPTGSVAVA